MKRAILGLNIALLTFCVGTAAVAIHAIYSGATAGSHAVPTPPTSRPQTTPASFPGLSVPRPAMGRVLYFPPGTFSPNQRRDRFIVDWYVKHLTAMGEESLYMAADHEEGYRFLWMRSFHHPVCVRLWRNGGEWFITTKQASGSGGHEPGGLTPHRTRWLTGGESKQFLRLLERAAFWRLPVKGDELAGLDGAQWVMEGIKEGRYHVADRWSPRGGEYHEVCLYLLSISGLGVDPSGEDVY